MDQETLKRLAGKYIWWKTPEEAIAMPARVAAQVMNIGDYDDVQALAHQVGDQYLRDVLRDAEIGQFNERSWAYWHYRLGLSAPGCVPPMPVRKLANAYTVLVPCGNIHDESLKVSFFGTIGFGRIGEPECTDEGGDLHTLSQTERETLIAAVSAVRDLPDVKIVSRELASTRESQATRCSDSGFSARTPA